MSVTHADGFIFSLIYLVPITILYIHTSMSRWISCMKVISFILILS